jgi:zinc protease
MSNPQFYFSDKVSKILTQNHPRGGGFPTPADLEAINFERSFEIYQDRFADASDFTFVFVGNFNIAEITPLLETYLGGLPSISRKETWKDLGVRPPSGKVEEVVNKGSDQKSSVNIVFTDETKYTKEDSYNLRTLGELLTIKLIEILREEKGGVYGVGASGSISKYPYENYTFRIGFPCGPDNVDDLVRATFDEIEKIKKEGASQEDINKLKETQRKERKDNLKENQYWLNSLYAYYYNNYDLSGYYEYEKQIENLTSKDLQETAKKFLPADEYIKIVLMPEEGK